METSSEPAQPELESTKSPLAPTQYGSIGPFCFYVAALLFVDLLVTAVMQSSRGPGQFFSAAFITLIVGQVALAIIIGGLMADNWVEGLLWSTLVVISGIALSNSGSGGTITPDTLRVMAVLPLVCFVAALPLTLLRWTIGWSLRAHKLPPRQRTRLNIEDMILVPASVAAICVMATFQDRGAFTDVGIFYSVFLPFLSLIFILPFISLAFRVEDTVLRWLFCLGYPLAVVIVVLVGFGLFTGSSPGNAFGWSAFVTLGASCVTMVGMQILYSNGYRLSRFASAEPALRSVPEPGEAPSDTNAVSPFDIEDTTPSRKPIVSSLTETSRRRHRIAVGILIFVTVMANFGFVAYAQLEQRRWLERVVSNGGSVEMENGKPTRITFGPSATDFALYDMPSMPSVKYISLAGTEVKSPYLLSTRLRSLESVDIRRTTIDPRYIDPNIRSIEILVSEGQFPDSEVNELTKRGYSLKQVAD